ncbi:unnamed protein product [Dicrocoelium dendriticum]|nr:unnamed protein product [Dicrocoelium dendriticum]
MLTTVDTGHARVLWASCFLSYRLEMNEYHSQTPPRVPPHANPRPGIFRLRRTTIQSVPRVPTIPTHVFNTATSQSSAQKQEATFTTEDKKVLPLQRLVKRFSVRPSPKVTESIEPKRRVSMLNHWRRRRSSVLHNRDRSPLQQTNSPQTPVRKETKMREECAGPPEAGWLKLTFRDLRRRSNLLSQLPKTSGVIKSPNKPRPFDDRCCQRSSEMGLERGEFTSPDSAQTKSSPCFLRDSTPILHRQTRTSSLPCVESPEIRSSLLSYHPTDEVSISESESLSLRQCAISQTDSLNSSCSASTLNMPVPEVVEKIRLFASANTRDLCASKPVGQDSGWSSELSSLSHPTDPDRSEELTDKHEEADSDSCSLAESCATGEIRVVWANRLRKSLDRAQRSCRMSVGQTLFNRDPVEGVRYFLDHSLVPPVPIAIARLLMKQTGLSRQAIGDYFGSLGDPMSTKVLREFLSLIDMKGREVDESIRSMLNHFHPAGESQKISHLVQIFQEVYTAQNPELVSTTFRSKDTIEVLAYSILMLHTDLHNPNLRRLGQRMTESEFINNNRGIDCGADLPVDLLRRIYRRVSSCEFKTLPDPVERLRRLDTILVGPLKTENFIQRHRRFVGWVTGRQLNRISTRHSGHHNHWRYLLVFNDILVLAKPMLGALLGTSGSLWNMAAAAAVGADAATACILNNSKQNQYFSDEPMTIGAYQVRSVLPLKDAKVLVFETQSYRYGLRLCNQQSPLLNFVLPSAQSRQKLIDWIHASIAELHELQLYRRQSDERKANSTLMRSQTTVLSCATDNPSEGFDSGK